jgi:hypothetical protein
MTYEDKMRLLANVRPEKKDELLLRISRGEVVDITKDEDLFFQINVDRISMERQVEREKYRPLVDDLKEYRKNLNDPKFGASKGKKLRYLGEIPEHLWFTHPWFSASLSVEERTANVKKFLNLFPAFRAGTKPI